jgi:phosphoribosylamine--glycine ligase
MKILIVGSGGREHALARKCALSPKVSEVLVAPGNGGTATEPRVRNVDVQPEDVAGLVALAKAERVGLTIIGPEGPLVLGVVDCTAGNNCRSPLMVTGRGSPWATAAPGNGSEIDTPGALSTKYSGNRSCVE